MDADQKQYLFLGNVKEAKLKTLEAGLNSKHFDVGDLAMLE